MLEELVRHLGDVDQSVLVDADVHKDAEVDDISHRPGQDHTGLQVLDLQHVRPQHRLGQALPDVPAGLHQLRHHVPEGGHAHPGVLRRPFLPVGGHLGGEVLKLPGLYIRQGVARQLQQLLRRRVALRVDGGVVQHRFALRHPEKARALLEGFRPQFGDLQNLFPGGEGAVGLPVGHDVPGSGGRQAGNPLKQGGRGGVYVHSHGVDAVLHHAVQRFVQPLGGTVVLVLPHADGFGVNLHQLRQGVL